MNNFINDQFTQIHETISDKFFSIVADNTIEKLNESFKQKQLIEYNQILKNCILKDMNEINRYIGKIELLIDIIPMKIS